MNESEVCFGWKGLGVAAGVDPSTVRAWFARCGLHPQKKLSRQGDIGIPWGQVLRTFREVLCVNTHVQKVLRANVRYNLVREVARRDAEPLVLQESLMLSHEKLMQAIRSRAVLPR